MTRAGERSPTRTKPSSDSPTSLRSREYAGTIFACARVKGPASYWRNEDVERDREGRWRSNIYAKMDRPHVFARPLPDQAFRPRHHQSRRCTHASARAEFREGEGTARREEPAPGLLGERTAGRRELRNVNATNWIAISCSPKHDSSTSPSCGPTCWTTCSKN